MKSIFPAVLAAFFLIIYFGVAAALSKDGSTPSHDNHSQPESIEQKKAPGLFSSSRGQMLYENHCLACHESQMHIRANTKVKNLSKLKYFVNIRSRELNLQWGDDEKNSVTKYLNERYYQMP